MMLSFNSLSFALQIHTIRVNVLKRGKGLSIQTHDQAIYFFLDSLCAQFYFSQSFSFYSTKQLNKSIICSFALQYSQEAQQFNFFCPYSLEFKSMFQERVFAIVLYNNEVQKGNSFLQGGHYQMCCFGFYFALHLHIVVIAFFKFYRSLV